MSQQGTVPVSGLPTPPETPPSAEPSKIGRPPNTGEVNTQGKANRLAHRKKWPAWMQELPVLNFEPAEPDLKAPIIDPEEVRKLLADYPPEVVEHILEDIRFMDYELLRMFRERDYAAKRNQNRYRSTQIAYLVLAAFATAIGSAQALALSGSPAIMPWFAFIETVIALMATYLATIGSREPPMPLWLANRRRAEQMRREFFRYMMNLMPYRDVTGYARKMLLSKRIADINRGVFPPDDTSDI